MLPSVAGEDEKTSPEFHDFEPATLCGEGRRSSWTACSEFAVGQAVSAIVFQAIYQYIHQLLHL